MIIQVVQRCFSILEAIHGQSCMSLQALSEHTGINKSTLCNILSTLYQLGYVEKSNGKYFLSEKVRQLSLGNTRAGIAGTLAKGVCHDFIDATQESIVLTVLSDEKVVIKCQDRFIRPIMFDASFYSHLSLYHSVSGRVLIAYLKDEHSLQSIIRRYGWPGSEWDGISSASGLEQARRRIREQGLSEMVNEREGIKAYALPFFDSSGEIAGALGLTFPLYRGGRNEAQILRKLKKSARFLSQKSKAFCIGRADWLASAEHIHTKESFPGRKR